MSGITNHCLSKCHTKLYLGSSPPQIIAFVILYQVLCYAMSCILRFCKMQYKRETFYLFSEKFEYALQYSKL